MTKFSECVLWLRKTLYIVLRSKFDYLLSQLLFQISCKSVLQFRTTFLWKYFHRRINIMGHILGIQIRIEKEQGISLLEKLKNTVKNMALNSQQQSSREKNMLFINKLQKVGVKEKITVQRGLTSLLPVFREQCRGKVNGEK